MEPAGATTTRCDDVVLPWLRRIQEHTAKLHGICECSATRLEPGYNDRHTGRCFEVRPLDGSHVALLYRHRLWQLPRAACKSAEAVFQLSELNRFLYVVEVPRQQQWLVRG